MSLTPVSYVALLLATPALGHDWPTYRGDARRCGVSREVLELPLRESWVHRASHPPRPSWPDMPARQNVLARIPRLDPTTTYDHAYHVAIAGDRAYYGSSADDRLNCLDIATGTICWTFTTEGPVRLAPTISAGRVYFGSDDGLAYCLSGTDGRLLWKQRAGPADQRLPGNGRMISLWPIRSGVVVDEGAAYFCGGLFPTQGVHLCAVSAESGKLKWRRKIDVTSQGYMLASRDALFVPTGRTSPVAFSLKDGKRLGSFGSVGGCFAIVQDDLVAHGPSESGQIHISSPASRDRIVSTKGLRLVADGQRVYILERDGLRALDRTRYIEVGRRIATLRAKKTKSDKDKHRLAALEKQHAPSRKWRVDCSGRYALILVGGLLLTGGDGEVAAHRGSDGECVWRGKVEGKAHGLAVADGRLLVSTDKGIIHCFASNVDHRTSTAVSRSQPTTTRPYPDDGGTARYRNAAGRILAESGVDRGYCLVLDAGVGGLARQIALRSNLRVVCVESDAAKVAEARRRFAAAGLLGVRIAIHHVVSDELPYPKHFANLIVSDGSLRIGRPPSIPAGEISRVLRPCGGTLAICVEDGKELSQWANGVLPGWSIRPGKHGEWGVARRPRLMDEGEWTHAYADPANTACSGDRITTGPMVLRWFGRPGPARMIDRHSRNVPPLYKSGRLFVPGDCIVYAMDAYNGTILWQAEIPDSRRVGEFLGCGSMTVDDSFLHVAVKNECIRFDVKTGRRAGPFSIPSSNSSSPGEWGYIAWTDDLLLGSVRPTGTAYDEVTRNAQLNTNPIWYPNMKLATSVAVFGMERASGRLLWTYRSGRVMDATLTVGDGRLFFVETHAPDAMADNTGRLTMRTMVRGDQFLVALDARTGNVVYKRKLDMRGIEQPAYLSYARGLLLLSGSRIVGGEHIVSSGAAALEEKDRGGGPIRYAYRAFDAGTGEPRWRTEHDTGLAVRGGHGEYNRHPTIVGETIFAWPYAYHLATGQRVDGWHISNRNGCGGVSASARSIFLRNGNPVMIDLKDEARQTRLTRVTRPGCWINIIPAGGMVLIPEASSGCTCGYSIQTSLGFSPRDPAAR